MPRLSPLGVLAAVRSGRVPAGGAIVVAGAPALVPVLARELRAGGNPAAVREGSSSGGDVAALVWVGEPDEEALRSAARDRVPIVAVTDVDRVPYVLDTDIVRVPPGEGFPMDEIAAVLARRLGDRGPSLAAALPVLREPVVDRMIRTSARRNGIFAAGVFVPGIDMPVITAAQIRLVMRIAAAHGQAIDRSRAAEVLGVIAAGFGFRALARQALGAVPAAGWALKGGFAFAGTLAVGEAARRLYAERG